MRWSVTHEWLSLVVLAALLTILGLLFSLHLLIVLALPPLSVALVSLLFPFEPPEVTVSRSVNPALVEEGQSTEVRINVSNTGNTMCHLSFVEPAERQLSAGFVGLLAPGRCAEVHYRLSRRRGLYRLPSIELEISDGLGMRVARRDVEAPAHLTVWPRSERLRSTGPGEGARLTQSRVGRRPTSSPGGGTEWLGVRGYSTGDPLRRVNWRAWARTDQPYTNDYGAERSVDVWMILDARTRSELRDGDRSLFERSVTAAASVSRLLVGQGNRLALLIYGGTIDFVPLGSGPRQLERIMTRLATVRPAGHVAFATYANLPTRLFRPGNELYFVTPLAGDDAQLVVGLSGAGFRVTVLSPDPVAFEAASICTDRAGEAASRIVRLEREAALLTLVRGGCRVIDWPPDEPLAARIVQTIGSDP